MKDTEKRINRTSLRVNPNLLAAAKLSSKLGLNEKSKKSQVIRAVIRLLAQPQIRSMVDDQGFKEIAKRRYNGRDVLVTVRLSESESTLLEKLSNDKSMTIGSLIESGMIASLYTKEERAMYKHQLKSGK